MIMFWKNWILTFWSHPLSPPRGSGTGLGSIWFATWPCSEKIKFWHFDPTPKSFATMLLHSRFPLICNMTMFWINWILTCWGEVGLWAKYLLLYCCICNSLKFDMQHDHVLPKLNLTFWPTGSGRGGCGQNICYHITARSWRVRIFAHSVHPFPPSIHTFLSVWNHISVPIGQI